MILTIGRASNSMTVDVSIPRVEDTVGRIHAELSILPDGRLYLLDKESVNGTFLFNNGEWEKINSSYVTQDSRVKFGEYETIVSEIMDSQSRNESSPGEERPEIFDSEKRVPNTSSLDQRVATRPYYDADQGGVIQ